jgi:hypothetical protein
MKIMLFILGMLYLTLNQALTQIQNEIFDESYFLNLPENCLNKVNYYKDKPCGIYLYYWSANHKNGKINILQQTEIKIDLANVYVNNFEIDSFYCIKMGEIGTKVNNEKNGLFVFRNSTFEIQLSSFWGLDFKEKVIMFINDNLSGTDKVNLINKISDLSW